MVSTRRLNGQATTYRLAALLLAAATLVLFGTVRAQSVPNTGYQATGITVNGSGAAFGEPDRAIVTLGTDSVADNVRDALARSDEAMERVRAAALMLGVQERQIRTASFNVWRQQLTDRDGQPTGERYHVRHSFEITVDNTDIVGELLGAAIDAGANDVGGIRFTISDTAALQSQAREAAMADAHARASQLAELAGVSLGAPVFVEETSYNAPQVVARAQEFAMVAGAPPVEGGELAVNVTVRVVYAIGTAAE